MRTVPTTRVRLDPPRLWSSPVGREPRRLIEVRAVIRGLLRSNGTPNAIDDVCLLATELLSNGLRHTSGEGLQLTIVCLPDHVRIEVATPPGKTDVAAIEPSLTGGGGFGLHLVDALAEAWGVRHGAPTVVWATVRT